jgi:hypothetical protein
MAEMSAFPDFDPFAVLRDALNAQYKHMLPEGFDVYKIAEYDPVKHPAPNLWYEKTQNPAARYLVILTSDYATAPALGITVNDALAAAILKVEQRKGAKQ